MEIKPNLLAARLKSGERQAAVELVDKFYKQIYHYLRRLGHSRQTSEDLTQESFIRAWQHTEQLRDGRALGGWVYRIAGNVSRQYWRRHKHKGSMSVDQLRIEEKDGSEAGDPEDFEQLERLNNAVMGLSLKLREPIVLHYMQQLTISEATQALGIREGTFKSRLNRALKALRRQMK